MHGHVSVTLADTKTRFNLTLKLWVGRLRDTGGLTKNAWCSLHVKPCLQQVTVFLYRFAKWLDMNTPLIVVRRKRITLHQTVQTETGSIYTDCANRNRTTLHRTVQTEKGYFFFYQTLQTNLQRSRGQKEDHFTLDYTDRNSVTLQQTVRNVITAH